MTSKVDKVENHGKARSITVGARGGSKVDEVGAVGMGRLIVVGVWGKVDSGRGPGQGQQGWKAGAQGRQEEVVKGRGKIDNIMGQGGGARSTELRGEARSTTLGGFGGGARSTVIGFQEATRLVTIRGSILGTSRSNKQGIGFRKRLGSKQEVRGSGLGIVIVSSRGSGLRMIIVTSRGVGGQVYE